ncbi:hypothetical protein [Hyphomonas sp. UBA4494]|jgi:hypothetical protein|uniref:hypothetical protein n=1 Tax=Hyphomonas sp. UBA4494 TaxID=1946631 RepID=UPI0025BC4F81|nr:hypothetical protein [Hyphomonas sp. UBA4494]
MPDDVNVYDTSIPVEKIAERLALTEADILSLACCAPNAHIGGTPPEGQRSAYIKTRLHADKLVLPQWCRDKDREETFFTWVRTQPGERLLDYYRANGFDAAEAQARLREAGE